MKEDFVAFVEKERLFSATDKILLAVSGGIDSIVLSDLFARAGYAFAIVHCNFQLRGEDSFGDEVFVREMAETYQVPCFVKTFDTYKEAEQSKESIQMIARRLRYDWFQQLLADKGYQYIATAHHKNDVLETIIFNLTKGTGIAGVRGILPKHGKLIRPLLFAQKEQIVSYLQSRQLKWREDSSNSSLKYARNQIRHQVVPVLEKINPSLFTTLNQTVERLQATEKVFLAYVAHISALAVSTKQDATWIHISELQKAESAALVLAEILKPYGFGYDQSQAICQCLDSDSQQVGKTFYATRYVLFIDRQYLIVKKHGAMSAQEILLSRDATELSFAASRILQIRRWKLAQYRIIRDKSIAGLDLEKLHFPLTIRIWQAGDRFQPLGMNSSKKLSDFLVDEKVPLALKGQVFVLLSGKDIVWVMGMRIDHRYRITEHTRQVLEIKEVRTI